MEAGHAFFSSMTMGCFWPQYGALELEGCTVIAAASAREALASMEQACPELIVADMMMPEMDGYAFYEAVQARSEWACVLLGFLTAKTSEKDFLTVRVLGVDRYSIKSFRVTDLPWLIRALLARAAGLAEQDGTAEKVTTLGPAEAAIVVLLAHVKADPQLAPPVLTSIRLCGRPTRRDLSLFRNDQLASLDAVTRRAG